jgi:uncharacterized protein with von Willebrand factor type A (vWA) domain
MNERIKQLADQADLYARSDNSSMIFENYQKRYTEKFFELIVQECVDIVSKVPNGYRDYRNQIEDAMRADCLQAIQEHFGVEE